MMDAPQFPESREITLQDKPIFDAIFKEMKPQISAYTFTNMYAWRRPYNIRLSLYEGLILVSYNADGKLSILEPLGAGDKVSVIRKCLQISQDIPTNFKCISSSLADSLKSDNQLSITFDRDNADYLYNSEDLINLPGRKYDAKRNFINRLKSRYSYEYIEINAHNAVHCDDFADQWCIDRSCSTSEGLSRERCAVYEMLTNFKELGICGGAIAIDGRITAFSLGEAINHETIVVHVEKADAAVDGIYQLINNEFCIHEAGDFKYVNREQDLGIPGLRKAKESYHPAGIVETYRIELA